MIDQALSPFLAAPQHGPRPLPLFLEILRSETAASPPRRAAALAGLARYQQAPRIPRAKTLPLAAQAGRARLRDYGGAGRPVVLIPSLINPPLVLDLSSDKSLAAWIRSQGFRPLLVDWGEPSPNDRDQDVTAHVEQLLLPMLRSLGERPTLVGYCLGGSIAIAAAAALPPAGLALIATPWRFSQFESAQRETIAGLWAAARPACEALGLVPMEVLQAGFWQLDPSRTIAKFEALAEASPAELAAFVALEDWANAGAPLTLAAGRQMFERFFGADDPGLGEWRVEGRPVDPHALTCPVIDFVSRRDRIVPAASSAGLPDRHELDAGHVGMVVGSRARDQLWRPLTDWLSALPAPR